MHACELCTYVTLVGHFEGARPRHHVEDRLCRVLVRNQVAVQFVVHVRLWNLVFHDDRVRDYIHDGGGDWPQTKKK